MEASTYNQVKDLIMQGLFWPLNSVVLAVVALIVLFFRIKFRTLLENSKDNIELVKEHSDTIHRWLARYLPLMSFLGLLYSIFGGPAEISLLRLFTVVLLTVATTCACALYVSVFLFGPVLIELLSLFQTKKDFNSAYNDISKGYQDLADRLTDLEGGQKLTNEDVKKIFTDVSSSAKKAK